MAADILKLVSIERLMASDRRDYVGSQANVSALRGIIFHLPSPPKPLLVGATN